MAPTQPDLAAPPAAGLPGASAWVLTDGKAGDETQCLAVAERLGLSPEIRRVAPGAPFAWLMPWGPIDPRERAGRPGSPVAPPFPDLAIASGRRAVPYLRAVKRLSGGRSFTVFLKDPRTGPGAADLVWAPSYDRIEGPNVVRTLTAPHRFSPERLEAARARPDPRLSALPAPRAAVLAGGDSRHGAFSTRDVARLAGQLRSLAAGGVSLMITTSRRTPPGLAAELRALARDGRGFLWDGTGENPYASMLALADAIVVTADSVNMLSEAVATGAPVLVFEPEGGVGRLGRFLAELKSAGLVKSFGGKLECYAYEKLDSTPVIAQAVAEGFAAHRAAIRAAASR
ncbi:mitochondrial fission ELM1 family protein [Enterovirga aerilata]|uniref:Nucleoside-diphosphate sugar epimerase n=1 Tax=Enterovirga aerilata TaxID=2730920 RepID=A0A849I5W6_9HYPH|nr:mitochondrial fission ELM1 family protein [Enterovirga sp. DB1703]NNM73084.1 nucleoside-diphosphate sugar epimerase [Enterovirga sp. DB1703]